MSVTSLACCTPAGWIVLGVAAVGGIAGAVGGYAGIKSTAEDAWDALFG